MIPKETISEIIDKTNIISVIGDYVKLRKRGANYIGLCPFHNEKTPSFSVSPEKNIWHCFGCNQGGNIISFISKIENFNFVDTIKQLANTAGVDIIIDKSYQDLQAPLLDALRKATDFYHRMLFEAATPEPMKYLKSRGLTLDNIKELKLGYAPRHNLLLKFLKLEKVPIDNMLSAGLILKRDGGELTDRFQDRIMFPIQNLSNETIAFGGRVIPALATTDKIAKYINSSDSDIYHKGRVLYGLNLSREYIKKAKIVVVVEGYMDYLALFLNGIRHVVATLGTAFTIEQARLLKRYTNDVILGYDADEAGTNAAVRAAEIMMGLDINVKIAQYTRKDPDLVIAECGVESLHQQINEAVPFVMFRIDHIVARYNLSVPESISKALSEIADFLMGLNKDVVTDTYIKYISTKLNISEDSVYSRLKQSKYYRKHGGYDQSRLLTNPKNDKYIKSQEIVIRVIANKKELREQTAATITAECFNDDVLRQLFELLVSSQAEANVLLEEIEDEVVKNRFAGILINDIQEEVKIFGDNVNVLKQYPLDQKFKLIEKSIKDAQDSKNMDVLNTLLIEYNQMVLNKKQ